VITTIYVKALTVKGGKSAKACSLLINIPVVFTDKYGRQRGE
jgi:hypothetical protein